MMEILPLILIAFIVDFGLTLVQSHEQFTTEAVAPNRVKDGGEIQKDFQNLFDSVAKNDAKNREIYRGILKNEVAKEQQAFHEIKRELLSTRNRNSYKKRNFNLKSSNREVKRETHDQSNVSPSKNVEKPLSNKLDYSETASNNSYARRKLPLGMTDIRQIIEEGYTYVDKTGLALHLIRQGRGCHVARPNGFGKTLFLSTLEQILHGNRELFRGTEIYRSDYAWTKYTVYKIDFSQLDSSNGDAFENDVKEHAVRFIESYGVPANKSENLSEILDLFSNVSIASGADIAVLVDEYDTPITKNVQYPRRLEMLNTAETHRQVIAFFLKFLTRSMYNPHVKFAFVVGVNMYEWIGGAPRHILNIDLDAEYATLMGFTEDEVRAYFGDHIRDIARERSGGVTEQEILDEMRGWYGGYRFTHKEVTVYNPESTLRYLSTRRAENYWYVSRNRSRLIDEAARDDMPLGLQETTVGLRLKPDQFNISYLRVIDPRSLMFYAGYVTIRKCDPEKKYYDLDFPNKEARDAYNMSYLLRDRTKERYREM